MTAEDLFELLDAPRVADIVAIVRRMTDQPGLTES
jgi:hypothetical protein